MKILISDKLQEEGIKIFKDNGFEVVTNFEITNEQLKNEIGKYDGIVIRSRTKLTAEVLEHAKNLKAIGRAGVGLDNVDREKAAELNIEVLNTPEAPSVSVAELALGLMFTLARHISNADRTMHNGEWNKKQYLGYTLKGKKLGLIGFGNIAKQLAKKAVALEMEVGVYSRFSKGAEAVEEAKNIGCKIYSSIDTLLNIKLMKKDSILINTARGKLIEEKALINALLNKEIGGAALDVFREEPLKDMELINCEGNLILTPHLGAQTIETQVYAATKIAEKMSNYLKNL